MTVRGDGRGDPNQEYALALADLLRDTSGISALAADTDGADGGTSSAADARQHADQQEPRLRR